MRAFEARRQRAADRLWIRLRLRRGGSVERHRADGFQDRNRHGPDGRRWLRRFGLGGRRGGNGVRGGDRGLGLGRNFEGIDVRSSFESLCMASIASRLRSADRV